MQRSLVVVVIVVFALLTVALFSTVDDVFVGGLLPIEDLADPQLQDVFVGGLLPIEDLADPQVQEIARFAVAENNKKLFDGALKLSRVVSGDKQLVAGLDYRLIIEVEVSGGGEGGEYEADVWDRPWENFRELISFNKVVKTNK